MDLPQFEIFPPRDFSVPPLAELPPREAALAHIGEARDEAVAGLVEDRGSERELQALATLLAPLVAKHLAAALDEGSVAGTGLEGPDASAADDLVLDESPEDVPSADPQKAVNDECGLLLEALAQLRSEVQSKAKDMASGPKVPPSRSRAADEDWTVPPMVPTEGRPAARLRTHGSTDSRGVSVVKPPWSVRDSEAPASTGTTPRQAKARHCHFDAASMPSPRASSHPPSGRVRVANGAPERAGAPAAPAAVPGNEAPKVSEAKAYSEHASLVDEAPPKAAKAKLHKQGSGGSIGVRSVGSGGVTSCTSIAAAPPEKGFVINVRRLIEVQQQLDVVHEFIKSTAIAALTLVQAGTVRQLVCSSCFVCLSVLLYTLHSEHWDRFDIEDYEKLVPLLANDEESNCYNPNRILKAIRVTTCHWIWPWFTRIVHLSYFVLLIFLWLVSIRWWGTQYEDDYDPPDPDFLDKVMELLIYEYYDGETLSTQLLVGTFMWLLHLTFEFMYRRETCGVMPLTAEGKVFDPRRDELPIKYWFGLPSMWFTSERACRDLVLWIEMMNPSHLVHSVHPEEMALYALKGVEERETVAESLKHAKLFDGESRCFVDAQRNRCEVPEALDLELVFFDRTLQSEHCPRPGEFLCLAPTVEDEEEEQQVEPAGGDVEQPVLQQGSGKLIDRQVSSERRLSHRGSCGAGLVIRRPHHRHPHHKWFSTMVERIATKNNTTNS